MPAAKSYEWETPPEIFNPLDREFGFTTDVAASDLNTKCKHYYTIREDGLKQEWRGVCWMNPPYGQQLNLWMRKAYESALNGAVVVCLIPSRTDTRWWHEYAMRGIIRFIKGRIRFVGSPHPAPFPSSIIILDPINLKNNAQNGRMVLS
ncbi:MAG TPA: DNA N-6-adenine-methyltransferase [Anaerolineae bacterium]|nr:DNA N-6-adenine-methyltransferase [Anaerolineae bacterium]